MTAGTCTTTYKMKLNCSHFDWLQETKQLYNKVVEFYYHLLIRHPDLWELSCQKALRKLEQLTLVSRDGQKPLEPIPFERVPVYFRRAAINSSIAMVHTYQSNRKVWQQKKESALNLQKVFKKTEPGMAKEFHLSPLFYKGMYKELQTGSENTILLKLFTGKSWCWVKCRWKGRVLPKGAEFLSPTIVLTKQKASLHIPVQTVVEDTRTAKERLDADENICGVTFTNTDAFVVCVIYSADGRAIASRFIKGGKQYVHHSKRLLNQISANRKVMGNYFQWAGANKKYWKHLRNLSEYWAHKVSWEILKFCSQYQVKVITMAKIEDSMENSGETTQRIPFHIRRKTGIYSPFMLRYQIKQKLDYKAWKKGIVITGVRPHYTASKCAHCREYITKISGKERIFRCINGHAGNRDLNTAKNIAKMTLKKYGKEVA